MPLTAMHPNLRRLLAATAWLVACQCAHAARCEADDFITRVSSEAECVLIASFGLPRSAPPQTLVVWLHGDHSGGGLATSHLRPARDVVTRFAADGVVAIAMWRPGYEDAQGQASGGQLHNRSDHYTAANVAIVGDAIAKLQAHWQPARTVLVGHSGGAATVAILLGMRPALVDAALLLSCPCDLRAWRAHRAWWPRSEDPLTWAVKAAPTVKVLALTGSADDNTTPALAQRYVETLGTRGVDARFALVPNAGHNSILSDAQVMDALSTLLK